MPSTRLTDLETELASRWLDIRDEWESAHPGNRLVVTATYRSPEEQQALYRIGRMEQAPGVWILDKDPKTQIVTQLDGTVRASKHNVNPARALDFFVELFGKPSWDPAQFAPIGELAKKAGLAWGGDFSFRDYGHIELT